MIKVKIKYIYLPLVCSFLAFSSCKKEGCTDESATNYSSEAKKNDGSCLYNIAGTWTISSYIANGTDITNAYTYYYLTMNSAGTYYAEALSPQLNNGDWVDVYGLYTLNSSQTTLTLTSTGVDYYNNGVSTGISAISEQTVWNINSFNNNSISCSLLSSTDPSLSSGQFTFVRL
jgi:hypothetical protein